MHKKHELTCICLKHEKKRAKLCLQLSGFVGLLFPNPGFVSCCDPCFDLSCSLNIEVSVRKTDLRDLYLPGQRTCLLTKAGGGTPANCIAQRPVVSKAGSL